MSILPINWHGFASRPSATMPGIEKLPIEETLEDSPQVMSNLRVQAQLTC